MFKFLVFLSSVLLSLHLHAGPKAIATWNVDSLGASSNGELDEISRASDYADLIIESKASFFALQEVGASHSLNGHPRSYYLDQIIQFLRTKTGKNWSYQLDGKNKALRLAFLYDSSEWSISRLLSVWPGSSFKNAEIPFLATVEANGSSFNILNIDLNEEFGINGRINQEKNLKQLADYLEETKLSNTIIMGDTHISSGKSAEMEEPLLKEGYQRINTDNSTYIKDGVVSGRFDRVYVSEHLSPTLINPSATESPYAMVTLPSDPERFSNEISDHLPVVLWLDL